MESLPAPEKKKHAGGRPSDYKPEYCQEVMRFGKLGKFHFEFANSIDKHVDTIYEWGKVHKEFSVALKIAKQQCEEFWLNMGRSLIATSPKEHDSKPWWYIMNNLHGWGEKRMITGMEGGPIQVEAKLDSDSLKELKAFLRNAAKGKASRKPD